MSGVSLEVIIALIAGLLVGVLLSRTLSIRKKKSLVGVAGRSTLFLTYVLVFIIGVRISQILPDIMARGQQVLVSVIMFSVVPATLSLVVSYLMLRG